MKFRAELITDYKQINLDRLCEWNYNWWGVEEEKSKEYVEHFLKYSFHKDKLPLTIVVFNEQNEEVAMCQITMHDLDVRPDIYPYLANLYVQEDYRGNGIVKLLIDRALSEAKRLGLSELFLYTKHVGLYEKYGWEFIGEIDTFLLPRIQRLYKINIK